MIRLQGSTYKLTVLSAQVCSVLGNSFGVSLVGLGNSHFLTFFLFCLICLVFNLIS